MYRKWPGTRHKPSHPRASMHWHSPCRRMGVSSPASVRTVKDISTRSRAENNSPVAGFETGEEPISWAQDGRSLYVDRPGEMPVKVFRLEVPGGQRTLSKQPCPAILQEWSSSGPLCKPGHRAHVYGVRQLLSTRTWSRDRIKPAPPRARAGVMWSCPTRLLRFVTAGFVVVLAVLVLVSYAGSDHFRNRQ